MREMKTTNLPYIDNVKAILITIVVNIGVVFLFQWPGGIDREGLILDSVICVFLTLCIDLWWVFRIMKKLRAEGKLPSQVPVSAFMQKLPKNPIALGALYFLFFGVLTVGLNLLITGFFGIQQMRFKPWLFYKLIYTTLLSVKIVEYSIFRYVQPDWSTHGQGSQTVRNPIPRIGLFKEIYGSVTGNIALNIIIGSILGGAVLMADGSVTIFPTTAAGIPVTGLIFGLIAGVLVTSGVVGAMDKSIKAADPLLQQQVTNNRWYTWMPVRKVPLYLLVCSFVMIFSAIVLRALMLLFDLPYMNFFQFSIFITIYATIIGKPLSFLLIHRCMQKDYIAYILNKVQQKPA